MKWNASLLNLCCNDKDYDLLIQSTLRSINCTLSWKHGRGQIPLQFEQILHLAMTVLAFTYFV